MKLVVGKRTCTWRRTVASSAAVVALTAGCGIGDRQAHADRIHASRAAIASASPASGTVSFELELDQDSMDELEATERERLQAALSTAGADGNPTLTVQAGLDGKTRRAAVVLDAASPEPAVLFVDSEIFAKRRNARPSERRTWARLDLADLLSEERPIDSTEMTAAQILTTAASTINPTYLVDLVEGTLAGSVKVRGADTVVDTATTRYDGNISLDKAMTELDFDDDERGTRMRLFYLLGAAKDVVPSSMWIDDEGRLRRLELRFDQRVTRRRTNHLTVVVELSAFGGDIALTPPPADSTVTYERFGRLVRSVLPEDE